VNSNFGATGLAMALRTANLTLRENTADILTTRHPARQFLQHKRCFGRVPLVYSAKFSNSLL